MKKFAAIIALAAAMLLPAGARSQSAVYNMIVTLNDNTRKIYNTNENARVSYQINPLRDLTVAASPAEIPFGGGDVTFTLSGLNGNSWNYADLPTGVTYRSSISNGNTNTLTLHFPAATSLAAKSFSIKSGDFSHTVSIPQGKPKADLLDVVFNSNKSATDNSGKKTVTLVNKEGKLTVSKNTEFNLNAATFNPSKKLNGQTIDNGADFYRIDYSKEDSWINSITNGSTFETIVSFGDYSNDAETKWFSSTQAGGCGFLIPESKTDSYRSPSFVVKIGDDWRWLKTGFTPTQNRFYHIALTWQVSGTTHTLKIYVDGVLKDTKTVTGSYVPVTGGCETFTIGGDPNTSTKSSNQIANIFKGSVAAARIYDTPFDETQAKLLYEAAKATVNKANSMRYVSAANESLYSMIVTHGANGRDVFATDDVKTVTFVNRNDNPIANITVTASPSTVPESGGNVTFNVSGATGDWTYTNIPAGVTVVSKSDTELVLNFPAATEKSHTYSFSIISANDSSQSHPVSITQTATIPTADLLDVVFNSSTKKATDNSAAGRTVELLNSGGKLTVAQNTGLGVNTAKFGHDNGVTITNGDFYRIKYGADDNGSNSETGTNWMKRITDGATFETVVSVGSVSNDKETKWFSSTQSGGVGFLIPTYAEDPRRSLSLVVNISGWKFVKSNITPIPGRFYHVVATWSVSDNNHTFKIFVDGKLCATETYTGTFAGVKSGCEAWTIGGDVDGNTYSSNSIGNSFNGEVATARIYSTPLSDHQVQLLCNESKVSTLNPCIASKYLPECVVGNGFRYSIYGTGFKSGDQVKLVGSKTYTLQGTVENGSRITFSIPNGMTSGTYTMTILRNGSEIAKVGSCNFIYDATAPTPTKPGAIAHRGEHNDDARSENSQASLKKAMEDGYYGSEFDINMTSDYAAVVYHDTSIKIGNTTYAIQTSAYSTIQNAKLGNDETLPVLANFTTVYFNQKNAGSKTKLILELKNHSSSRESAVVTQLLTQLKNKNITGSDVEFIAFSYNACKLIANNISSYGLSGAKVSYLYPDANATYYKALDTLVTDKITGIDYSEKDYNFILSNYNRYEIPAARKKGLSTNVWTINTEAGFLKYIGQGVEFITTNQPAALKALNEDYTFLTDANGNVWEP